MPPSMKLYIPPVPLAIIPASHDDDTQRVFEMLTRRPLEFAELLTVEHGDGRKFLAMAVNNDEGVLRHDVKQWAAIDHAKQLLRGVCRGRVVLDLDD